MGEKTTVDVHSLEDFHRTLTARLDEANSVLRTLTTRLKDKPPRLGTFHDASETSTNYQTRYDEQVARAERLVRAVTATRDATGTIVGNYTTTEERNAANARDIADTMRSVGEALDGGRSHG